MASEISSKRWTAPATAATDVSVAAGFSDTPKGALWHTCSLKSLNTLATSEHLLQSYGFNADGTGQAGHFSYIWDEYNLGTSDNRVPYGSTGGADHLHMLTGVNYWTSGLRMDPDYAGFDAGTINCDVQTMSTPQFANILGGAMAFAGSDVEFACGLEADTSAATITISSLSFTPDLVFFYAEGNSSHTLPMCGVSLYNGSTYKHRSLSIRASDNVGTMATDCFMSDVYSCIKLNSSGAIEDGYVADTFTSTGFVIRRNTGAGDFTGWRWCAIKFGDGVDLVDVETPASTGVDTISGIGFVPKGLIEVFSPATALNTTYNGMSLSTTLYVQDEDISNQCAFSEDNVGTSAPGQIIGDEFRLYDDDATLLAQADSYTMVDDGYEKDYQTVPGTARKGFVIGFGGGRDDGSDPPLDLGDPAINAVSEVDGGLGLDQDFTGEADGTASVSAVELLRDPGMEGVSNGTSSVSATDLDVVSAIIDMGDPTINGTSSVSPGALLADWYIEGASVGAVSTAGATDVDRQTILGQGVINGNASAGGDLHRITMLAGPQVVSVSVVTGQDLFNEFAFGNGSVQGSSLLSVGPLLNTADLGGSTAATSVVSATELDIPGQNVDMGSPSIASVSTVSPQEMGRDLALGVTGVAAVSTSSSIDIDLQPGMQSYMHAAAASVSSSGMDVQKVVDMEGGSIIGSSSAAGQLTGDYYFEGIVTATSVVMPGQLIVPSGDGIAPFGSSFDMTGVPHGWNDDTY